MPDTDDALVPNAEIEPAPAAGVEPAPAESAPTTSEAVETGSEQLSFEDVVNRAIDKVEGQATPPAPKGVSPAPTDTPQGGEPAASDAPADAASAAAPVEPAADESAEAAGESDLTPAEMEALPKKTQRRINRLLAERGRFKEAATAYDNITSYMAENRLSGEEVAVGFDLMARLKKGDAAGFLKAVDPYIRSARMAIGEVLPDDIQQKVEAGYVDEDTAREVARTRAAAAAAQAALRDRDEQASAAQAASLAGSVRDALNSWDRANSSDPDFTASKEALLEYARASFKAEPPRTAQEAVDRIQAHWQRIRRRVPPPRSVAPPTPSSTHATGRPAARQPVTLMDAINIGIDRAYERAGAAS